MKRGRPVDEKMDNTKAAAIMSIYLARKTRGRRQVKMALERQYGIPMCLGSVHRYMKILNLCALRKRKYRKQKKEASNLLHTFPNVIKQDFNASFPGQKWLTDVTYLPTKDGTLFLSCIKDLSDKSIVAHHLSNKNDVQLVMETLEKARSKIRPGTVLHSDQGSQYVSIAYHCFLSSHGLIGSMSAKGTPYDNAPMESFFSILKNEELRLHPYLTMAQIRTVVDRFIEYYNSSRPQWALKKLTPAEYRSQFL